MSEEQQIGKMSEEQQKLLLWNKASTVIGIIATIALIINALMILPMKSDIKKNSDDCKELKTENLTEHRDIKRNIWDLNDRTTRNDERLKNIERKF